MRRTAELVLLQSLLVMKKSFGSIQKPQIWRERTIQHVLHIWLLVRIYIAEIIATIMMIIDNILVLPTDYVMVFFLSIIKYH